MFWELFLGLEKRGRLVSEENIRKAFGVEAIIGEVEASGITVKNVVPVGITK